MPTLFRMFLVLAILGGGVLGFLAYLGSSAGPAPEEVSIDVSPDLIGRGALAPSGS